MTHMTFFAALLQNFDLLLFFINVMDQFFGILDNFPYLPRTISILSILVITTILIKLYITKRKKTKRPKTRKSDIIYNTECPICYEDFTVPIKAGCGHAFCMDCLHQYWKITQTWETLCAICRAPIIQLELVEVPKNQSMKPYAIKIMRNIISSNSIRFQTFWCNIVFGTVSITLAISLILSQYGYTDVTDVPNN